MKRLLQINSVVNSGSTGRIAEEIGQTAINYGWQSYIAYGRNPKESKSELIRIGSNLDVKLHGIKTRLFDKHGLGSKKATKRLIKEIQNINPDIIHLHNIHGYYINIKILFDFLKEYNKPVVWTLHDCWTITGHCPHFVFIGCEKWKTQCYKCPQKKDYPSSLFIDRSRKNYMLKKRLFTSVSNLTLVPVSNWLGDILKESFLNKYPIKVINNGISTGVFKPVNSNFREKYNLQSKFILLGVTNIWSSTKGLDDFIKLDQKLEENYQIVLVGLTKKQKKDLPSNIIGIERTESVQELVEIYSVSDVFLNLTYQDTFPTTNLEALGCGTPVITYKTGGSPEAIDEKTGIVVEQGDMDGLIQAIKTIKTNGKKYYTDECLSRVERLYRKEDRYLDYIHLYEELLENKN